jgi:IS5 family transposase
MWLVGYLYGIPLERRLEQEIKLNLAYRWFLDLQLDERIPDHSTLSRNRNERFAGTDLFLAIFEEIVEQCKTAELVQGEAVVTDSTHTKANASCDSKETVVVAKTPRDYCAQLEDEAKEINEENGRSRGGGGRRGPEPQPNGPQVRERGRSATDPDAGRLARPGKPHGFHYLAHMTIEPTHGIILDADVTAPDISDHEPYVECICRAQKRHTAIREAAADGRGLEQAVLAEQLFFPMQGGKIREGDNEETVADIVRHRFSQQAQTGGSFFGLSRTGSGAMGRVVWGSGSGIAQLGGAVHSMVAIIDSNRTVMTRTSRRTNVGTAAGVAKWPTQGGSGRLNGLGSNRWPRGV